MPTKQGKQTLFFDNPPSVISYAAVASKKEGEGPLGRYFDTISEDSFFGEATWEKAESRMQKDAVNKALDKASLSPGQIDYIFAGDLGMVGSRLLLELLERDGIRLGKLHADCGLLIFDRQAQQVEAGGSGCGCAATVLCSYILPRIREGVLHNVLFIPTGALMSTTAIQQGETIPGIAHLLWLSDSAG